MARIRSIKPSFFTSHVISELSLSARLTFIGLWTHADDEGRAVDDARLIKAAVWPLDDKHTVRKVEADLAELAKANLIDRYEVKDRRYLRICSFAEHQKPNRPQESALPPPEQFTERAVNEQGQTTEPAGTTHPRSRSSRGEEKEGNDARFDAFWSAYPRHVEKRKAFKIWQARVRDGTDPDVMINAARCYAAKVRNDRTESRFVKHPSTFLGPDRPFEEWAGGQPEPDAYYGEVVRFS